MNERKGTDQPIRNKRKEEGGFVPEAEKEIAEMREKFFSLSRFVRLNKPDQFQIAKSNKYPNPLFV